MLKLGQLNNKSLFRQKLISSTITIVFLIAVMGIASLFAIWKMEREYNQNLLKVNGLKNISEELSLAQLNLKSADQEWKNLIIRARDKETKIKYKSLFEKKISAFQENIANIENGNKSKKRLLNHNKSIQRSYGCICHSFINGRNFIRQKNDGSN